MIHKVCKEPTLSKEQFEEYLEKIRSEYGDDRLQLLLNQKDEKKYSPLHVAIFHRNLIAIDLLLEYGADKDLKCHGTSPLHLAVRTAAQPRGYDFGSMCLMTLLKSKANHTAKDDNGYTIFHLMAMYNFHEMMKNILSLSFVETKNTLGALGKYDGFNALHIAAIYNSLDVAKLLIDHGISTKVGGKICGSIPIHLAAKYRAKETFQHLSVLDPASLEVKDGFGFTAKNVFSSHDTLVTQRSSAELSTGVYSSNWCSLHHTIAPSELHTANVPPENLWRLHVLINQDDGVLFSKPLRDRLCYDLKVTSASLCDILQVHEWSYIRRIQAACEELSDDAEEPNGMTHLDGDTAISKNTYRAALGAAGAVCHAVDEVMQGRVQNAFCPIRPPGHHVGARGAVKSSTGSDSHGFCLINNVSIGAAHAMNRYRESVRRVVIVDFDVHHGNGTESTVRNLRPTVEKISVNEMGIFGSLCVPSYKPWRDENDADNVLFVSVHGYGPPQRGMEGMFPRAAFYPGTGATTLPKLKAKADASDPVEPITGSASAAQTKSVDLNIDGQMAMDESNDEDDDDDDDDGDNAGNNENADDDDDDDDDDDEDYAEDSSYVYEDVAAPEAIPEEDEGELGVLFDAKLTKTYHMYDLSAPTSRAASRAPSPMILDIGVPLPENTSFSEDTVHSRLLSDFEYRHQWRNYFRDHIFPRIATFQPDLILISAGFDAHRKDTINAGYIALGEDDFVWVTEHLLLLAQEHCSGRVVSVLEGGYQIGGEYTSAFARSVAAHVETLSRAPFSQHYSAKLSNAEKACELKYMDTLRAAHEEEIQRRRFEQQQIFERQKEMYERNRAMEEQSAQTQTAAPESTEPKPEEEETSGRKRKRGSVDYAALEERLRKEGTL